MTDDASLPVATKGKGSRAPVLRLANLAPYLKVDREAARLAHGAERVSFPCIPAVRDTDGPAAQRHWREFSLKELTAFFERSPKQSDLLDLDEMITEALEAEPDRRVTRTALAVLLDTRTRLPLQPDLYVEAATADLMELGFQPAVVAAACQDLRRMSVFTPEIAEVVAACTAKRKFLQDAQRFASRASDVLYEARGLMVRVEDEIAKASAEAQPERGADDGLTLD